MMYSKVEGHMNLIRDGVTKAVINVSMSDYQKYLDQKTSKEHEIQKIKSLESEIISIKSDVTEIKNLLYKVINRV